MASLNDQIQALLAKVPDSQRQAASELLAEYGPRFFELAQEDAWQWLRRLLAGDLDAAAELDAKLSDGQFVAKVKTNTARWENVAGYNQVRDELRNELLLRLAPVVLNLLAGLVGL